jgi:hypothetical protein
MLALDLLPGFLLQGGAGNAGDYRRERGIHLAGNE